MTSTYRVQLTPDLGFREVARLVGYLRDLGVGRLYLSPILQAVGGSLHGYDVTDHGRVRAEFGGIEALRALAAEGLPLVADIVPNHMTVPQPESDNAQLWSALRDGPGSPAARWFDMEWPVALPVLGDDPGGLVVDGTVLRYYDHVFPIRPGTEHLPLPELLEAQHYRLVNWRESPGYRRFFDVSSLIGLRVEDPEVFDATHAVMLSLVGEGVVEGLRVDHPDGLADPRGYLERLRPHVPGPLWVEKILIDGERLPDGWPCDGTTGYDALNMITRLFVDPAGRDALIETFTRHTGVPGSYEPVRYEAKKHVIELFFRGEVDRLVDALGDDALREAAVELLAAMPVYRAYVDPGEQPSAESLAVIQAAARQAATRADADAVAKTANLVMYGPAEAVTRFQQTCGPVTAKGVEDTALYRWYPLAALNEVGGEPDRFGVSAGEFHAFCAGLAPTTMTTLSTHDTKRSEDVRARLVVLSELPGEWAEAVGAWSGAVRFDPRLDYLAWQTLMAAWPISAERFTGYLLKAAREAKTSVSWQSPDHGYEAGIARFAEQAIEVCGPAVAAFTAKVDRYARVNSLGQKLVQLMMPGVPDVYQGNEVTDFSLVDPDNRRPVDFDRRRRLLAAPGDSWDGQKLLLTTTALNLRKRLDPAAPYEPIEAGEHAIAFARGDRAVAVATRLPAGLERRGGWGNDSLMLPPGRWRDLLTERRHTGRILLGHLLSRHPVALLERAPNEER
ncbi:malto-oligosyltrehalose synthase [Planotetraspora thailandica]|uniref:Malto-oligosyltrehalose synthase n=1 Tax=Planotetraspora thailandica TaxID=487172 RepID=A0A8J3V301_9ACTN|nr:malto-oligosyltrehalose synthase [Planotetraspora thailandica]GII56432.1 malto-oligosyltrehalose synthase [Planotetraspora thailandica]